MKAADFHKLCLLCHIPCSEEEKQSFLETLDTVLSYAGQLQEVETEGVSPCFTVLSTLTNELRDDNPDHPLSRDLFLGNVPSKVGGMVRVPSVLKQG